MFGISRVTETAAEFGIETTARLPVDPAVAAACDQGRVEQVNTDGLKPIADMLEKMIK